jgi:potassium-transporting ATPase potassium-binding subunit
MNARQYAIAFVLFSLAGKLRTDSLLFASVIVGTALIVVALTYLPAVALGPIIEQLRF